MGSETTYKKIKKIVTYGDGEKNILNYHSQ